MRPALEDLLFLITICGVFRLKSILRVQKYLGNCRPRILDLVKPVSDENAAGLTAIIDFHSGRGSLFFQLAGVGLGRGAQLVAHRRSHLFRFQMFVYIIM